MSENVQWEDVSKGTDKMADDDHVYVALDAYVKVYRGLTLEERVRAKDVVFNYINTLPVPLVKQRYIRYYFNQINNIGDTKNELPQNE